jgi:glucose/arabinose dehydrogenase
MIRRCFERDSTRTGQAESRRQLIGLSRFPFTISVTVVLLLSGVFFSIDAATLPTGFVETQISGLSSPTAMDFAPDGRLFVCLQGGDLRVIKNGVLLPAVFKHLTVDSSGERGLLGIAFDPNFSTNNFVYVYYTVPGSPPHNRVSRFAANGDVAAGSETIILDLDNLSGASNHNGGAIHFGPDGKLYIAVGENANPANSQTLANLLGKILRINADGTPVSDNPFFNTVGARQEIWALGLRNPFTFAFQPGTTRMFINDVGQSAWEEINDGIVASNYGWPTTEGPTSNPNFRGPIFAYGHEGGATGGCAITGGTFYNPTTNQFPAGYAGKYFFADLCSGWIHLLNPADNTVTGFASGASFPVDLKVAADGSLYYLSTGLASVFRIQYAPVPPGITTHPSSQSVTAGQPVTFNVAANGSTPFSYQWQRNTVDIAGANSSSYTISTTAGADNGAKFRCLVTNAFGTATSNEATLTVNVPPSVTTHPSSQTVAQGQPVTFNVSASGDPPLNYQWQRNMVYIPGATSPSYTIAATAFADNGAKFRCVVSNGFGSANSNEATLTVTAPPNITTQPSDQTVAQGQPTTFTVSAGGSTPFSYQWQRNQVNIPGATSLSYMIAATAFTDNGAKFRCVVSNGFGSANSNEATLTVTAPPNIATQPSDQTVTQGQPVTFTVSAGGSTPFSYQWQRNTVNIPGATLPSYTIATTALADNSAKFRCVVSNSFGSATSNEATLTVQPPPPILQTEEGTDHAIAFDSVTMFRDPFALTNLFNFSSDNHTRIVLFAANLDLLPNEDSSAVTVRAEDPQLNVYPLTVEYVGKVPDLNSLTQVIVRLPDNLPAGQDVLVSITLHGQTSNRARITIR